MARVSSWLAVATLLISTSVAAAQGEEGVDESLDTDSSEASAAATSGDSAALEESSGEQPAASGSFRARNPPHEDPAKRYYFLGAGWRFSALPSWMLIKVDSEANVRSPASFFAEFAMRRKGFQIGVNVGYLHWAFADAFRLDSDPITDMEWLDTKFNFLVTTVALTWSTAFTDWFQLEYGLEAGLAFLFGRMIRSEATRDGGRWRKCETWADQPSFGFRNPDRSYPNPNASAEERRFCDAPLGETDFSQPPATNTADEEGEHYGVRANRGAFNKGVPYVLPVLGPRLSLRFKPIAQLVLRVDVPLPVLPFGFMGGVAAQYGFQ